MNFHWQTVYFSLSELKTPFVHPCTSLPIQNLALQVNFNSRRIEMELLCDGFQTLQFPCFFTTFKSLGCRNLGQSQHGILSYILGLFQNAATWSSLHGTIFHMKNYNLWHLQIYHSSILSMCCINLDLPKEPFLTFWAALKVSHLLHLSYWHKHMAYSYPQLFYTITLHNN